MADKVVIEAEVKSNVGQVGKDAKTAAGEFRVMGVSLNGVKAGFISAGKSAKVMFASIKAGLISTGIGAFLVAIGSLVSYFTNTKRGADKLAQAFTTVGAVVSTITDRLSKLGEALSFVFSGEFKKAGEALKGTFSGIADEVEREVKAMVALKKRTQELRDADNEFMIQKAKTRQEIEKARLIAEDETKSAKERLTNLKRALELEAQTTEKEIALAKERMQIQKEEMALSENMAEDEAELARLKAEIIEKETASIKMRRRVVTEVNALEREIAAEEKARAKEKQDLLDAEFDAMMKANDEWNKAQEEKYKKEVAAAKKAADEKIALDQLVEKEKEKSIAMGFEAAKALAGENEAASKAIAVAQTIYNTQQAIMNAMANVPAPWNVVQAVATGVMGATSIQKILSTSASTGGGGGGGGGGGVAAPATPAPQMMSGQFELGGGIAPEPLKAYVVTDEMTNSQAQLASIRRRATI